MIYLENLNNYGPYAEFITNKSMVVDVNTINKSNWDLHFNSVLNIMRDTIETEYCSSVFITIRFKEIDVELSLIDYWFNLIMWYLLVRTDMEIRPYHIFFDENMTRGHIKAYIDRYFIEPNRIRIENKEMNNILDDCLHRLSHIDEFSFFLAETINLEDFISLMNESPEFYDLLHSDLSNVPIDKVAIVNEKNLERSVNILKHSQHCLSNFFRAQEGVSAKQYKEFAQNIGTKPDGKGGVYPTIVNTNYLIGGVNDHVSNFIESSTGRVAQIVVEGNVGESGYFARLLGLNNIDSMLHEDPDHICDSKNLEMITIKSRHMLSLYEGRYYRFSPIGMEFKVKSTDLHLIDQTLYFRSPMTCASLSRTGKICYRCYGDLAYTNKDINIGKMAAELISSRLTQRMLSAKHLLEACMKMMKWTEGFKNIFLIEYNLIGIQDEIDLTGYKMIIDPIENESMSEMMDSDDFASSSGSDEYSNSDYMFYVNDFDIITPSGEVINMHTSEADNIYLTPDMMDLLQKEGKEECDKIEIDMKLIQESEIYLFAIQLLNNDISRSLERIKSIIDKGKVMEVNDRHSILQALIEALMEGGINVNSVHAEVLLSNQLRNVDDILELPQWQYPNEEYKLLSLKQALGNHPSVTVSMSFQKVKHALFNPMTFRKRKPSVMDLNFMERPQVFLTNDILEKDKDEQIKQKNYKKPIFKKI